MSEDSDDNLISALLGGFVGLALASPSKEDKQALENYNAFQQQINLRLQKISLSQEILSKLGKKPEYYNAFIESYRAYSYGLFRSSVVVSSALIENILREKFEGSLVNLIIKTASKKKVKKNNFYELIESAKELNLINKIEHSFLHGLRGQRNDSAHEIFKEVSEQDAIIILNITIKMVGKLL
ncbi:MAG: DUF4145 domain-containing protein [Patescibacteria group bacterium]|nr:DUF4145 domain-containing protein [Patescibacteria group bacterium]